jgi:hypothetical protein
LLSCGLLLLLSHILLSFFLGPGFSITKVIYLSELKQMLKIFEVNFAGKLSDHINYFKLKSKELT